MGMTEMDYNAPAGVYRSKASNRGLRRGPGLIFSRFPTLAHAIKYVVEDLGDTANNVRIEVADTELDAAEIHRLYESTDYPIERRAAAQS